MIDIGKPVKRNSTKIGKLASTVQGMMGQWTEDNFNNFNETMELIREGAPVQWVKLYMEAVKMGIVKESNINININRQQDRENLQALVRTRIQLPDSGTYVPYEEVKKPEMITIKPQGYEREATAVDV